MQPSFHKLKILTTRTYTALGMWRLGQKYKRRSTYHLPKYLNAANQENKLLHKICSILLLCLVCHHLNWKAWFRFKFWDSSEFPAAERAGPWLLGPKTTLLLSACPPPTPLPAGAGACRQTSTPTQLRSSHSALPYSYPAMPRSPLRPRGMHYQSCEPPSGRWTQGRGWNRLGKQTQRQLVRGLGTLGFGAWSRHRTQCSMLTM